MQKPVPPPRDFPSANVAKQAARLIPDDRIVVDDPRAPRATFVNVRLSASQRAVLEALAKERNRPLRHVAQDLIEEALRLRGASSETRAIWLVLTPAQRAGLERQAEADLRTPEQMLGLLVRPVLAALEVSDAAE
jgi:hypothetical protein